MEKIVSIGVDLGGTNLRAGIVDDGGKLVESLCSAVPVGRGGEAISAELAGRCRVLVDRAECLGLEVGSVGLGVAGKIDSAAGSVVFSPNLPALDGYPLGRELARELKLPVCMENDANAFGFGESAAGAAKGVRNWVGITLGTGTGGCLFLDGKLWEGDRMGFSAEIGHMIVEPGGPLCACGSKGCLESFASARAVVLGARRAVRSQKLKSSPLAELDRAGKLDALAIYECAKAGNETALALFDKMGWALGTCLAGVFSLLGIRCAVIGGGVSAAWDLFSGPLERALVQNSSMLDPALALVIPNRLGGDAAIIGAALISRDQNRIRLEP